MEAEVAIVFLDELAKRFDKPDTRGERVVLVMESAEITLKLGRVDVCAKQINESTHLLESLGVLDAIGGVNKEIHASFYRVKANFCKSRAEYVEFYKNALLYLTCVDAGELGLMERQERAHDLCIAALLGDTIYNFGDLLAHRILESLQDTEYQMLADLVRTFNSGDHARFEILSTQFHKHPLLQNNLGVLRQKLCLMSLVECIFKNSQRRFPFRLIAQETRLPLEEVELLSMKALSLGLIRGSLDQVDEVLEVEWVQPRWLDQDQVADMAKRIDHWNERVKTVEQWAKPGEAVSA